MVHVLKQEAVVHGDKLKMLSIERLQDLQHEIARFSSNEELNGFQHWIVNNIYKFEAPTTGFPIRSLLIIAVPHPAYIQTTFVRQGQTYHFPSLIMSDFEQTEHYLHAFLALRGYQFKTASNLPLKRLAVHSGLAVYGRNNICYVAGMGSFFSLAAYFSDIPCDDDAWTDIRQAERCTQCTICVKHCPTGAIRTHRFLIDNERCLSYFNERPDEFPEWLPRSVHHCLYDCLQCQLACPMNTGYVQNISETVAFSADETELLLSGCPFDAFPPALQEKSKRLGLDAWLSAIPRNLTILFELHDAPNP
jgi:epoxyqueuosine reductase